MRTFFGIVIVILVISRLSVDTNQFDHNANTLLTREAPTLVAESTHAAPKEDRTPVEERPISESVVSKVELFEIVEESGTIPFHEKAVSVEIASTTVSIPETIATEEIATETITITEPETAVETMSVRANRLNVRSGPGTKNPVVGKLERNQVVEVTGRQRNWVAVKSGSVEGWVYNRYLRAL